MLYADDTVLYSKQGLINNILRTDHQNDLHSVQS